jgi:endonuclease YncB( thermonuclease family)
MVAMLKRAGRGLLSLLLCAGTGASVVSAPGQDFRVLDGDSLLFNGVLVRVAGIDAPELGPWAKCWAEAALAGHSKSYLEQELDRGRDFGGWSLAEVSKPDGAGRRRARLARGDGEDMSDLMVVYGYAARTTARWDWCGKDANLHDPLEDEPPPNGPNLWWPTAHMFDARAAD